MLSGESRSLLLKSISSSDWESYTDWTVEMVLPYLVAKRSV